MSRQIGEIKSVEDAERVSKIILDSLERSEGGFNPFRGNMIRFDDKTIMFMGSELRTEEALPHIVGFVWKNRAKMNRHIRKWERVGPNFVDCGC